jgi:hypothetical protein
MRIAKLQRKKQMAASRGGDDHDGPEFWNAGVAVTVKLQSMPSPRRWSLLSLALILGACEGSFFSVGDRWHTPRIGEAYAARDACLAKNATAEAPGAIDPSTAAHAVAQACASETEKLVQISNRDGDSKVAGNIRDNSQFRAMGYVMRSRGQVMTTDVAQGSSGSVTPAR